MKERGPEAGMPLPPCLESVQCWGMPRAQVQDCIRHSSENPTTCCSRMLRREHRSTTAWTPQTAACCPGLSGRCRRGTCCWARTCWGAADRGSWRRRRPLGFSGCAPPCSEPGMPSCLSVPAVGNVCGDVCGRKGGQMSIRPGLSRHHARHVGCACSCSWQAVNGVPEQACTLRQGVFTPTHRVASPPPPPLPRAYSPPFPPRCCARALNHRPSAPSCRPAQARARA